MHEDNCRFRSKDTLGTLSKDVFERRTSTGSEAFSLFICLDANKLVLLSFFSLLKTIYPRVSTKPLPNDAKSPLPVDVRCPKTLLLKLPIIRLDELGQTFVVRRVLRLKYKDGHNTHYAFGGLSFEKRLERRMPTTKVRLDA